MSITHRKTQVYEEVIRRMMDIRRATGRFDSPGILKLVDELCITVHLSDTNKENKTGNSYEMYVTQLYSLQREANVHN